MISMKAKVRFDYRKVRARARRGNIESLGHAGGAVRLTAKRSIRRSSKPSAQGTPPHTREGRLKSAILYRVERQQERVVIGPRFSVAGPSGMAHEFGGRFRGARYPKRAFMGPALTRVRDRLPRMWAGSVR